MKKTLLFALIVSAFAIVGCSQSSNADEPKSADLAPGHTLEFTEGSEGTGGSAGGGTATATPAAPDTGSADELPTEN